MFILESMVISYLAYPLNMEEIDPKINGLHFSHSQSEQKQQPKRQ